MGHSCFFFDTSALFKRYVNEKGSSIVNGLLDGAADCYISLVTLTEIAASLRRLVDVDRLLAEEEFTLVKETFLGEIGSGTIRVMDLTPSLILASLEICSKKYMTPLDAIQLASALTCEGAVFVCSDKKLLQAAGEWGLKTINPEEK